MAVYDQSGALKEMPIYGSQRIGMVKALDTEGQFTHGNRLYEYSNHLGNVLAVSTDKMTTVGEHGDLISASNYYPFGLRIGDRSMNSGDYRYGFNGKEDDRDFSKSQLIQDYGFRLYNPALGKLLSVDPLTKSYPWYTPYQFAGNKPIKYIDLDGLEEYDPMKDQNYSSRLILTGLYDVKHAGLNTIFRILTLDTRAGYKQDANGTNQFETVYFEPETDFALRGFANEALNGVLDVFGIVGARSLNPSDLIFSKSVGSKSQTIRSLKEITHLNGRKIVNHGLKNQTIVTKSGYKVTFNKYGFPDFSPFAKKTVELPNMHGNYSTDFSNANELAGFGKGKKSHLKEYPYHTWHHHEDGKTMQLVPKDLNNPNLGGINHSGGTHVTKHNKNPNLNEVSFPSPDNVN